MYTIAFNPPTPWYTVRSDKLLKPEDDLSKRQAARLVAVLWFPAMKEDQLAEMVDHLSRSIECSEEDGKKELQLYDDYLCDVWCRLFLHKKS